MKNAAYDTDLTDNQWRKLEPLLRKAKQTGRPRTCLRRVVNALLYVANTGCKWASSPMAFPPKSTVHGFFRSWTRDGVLESMHSHISALARGTEVRRCRPRAAIVDSQTARSAGLAEQTGCNSTKTNKGRKRILLVDTLGYVLGVAVVPADVPERTGARKLPEEVLASPTWLQRLYVDGAFSGPDFAPHVAELKPSLARLQQCIFKSMVFSTCYKSAIGPWHYIFRLRGGCESPRSKEDRV